MKTLRKLVGFSLGPILGAVFSAVSVPISTHYLLPDEYGKTSMFNLMYTVLLMVAYLGYDQAFIREYHEYEDKKKVLLNSMVIPAFVTVILIIIVIPLAPLISYFLFESYNHTEVIYMLAIALPFLLLERFVLVNLRMQEKAFEYSFFSLFVKIIAFTCTLFFLFNIRQDFLAIIYSTLISHYIGDGLLILLYHRMFIFRGSTLDKELIYNMSKFSLPLVPATIVGTIFNGEDKMFIKYMSDYVELGYYQVSMTLAGMVLILQQAFSTFWTPLAYRWKAEKVSNKNYEYVQKTVCFLSCACFMGILFIKNLLPIVLSEKYSSTKYILPFLLFYPVMSMMVATTGIGIDFIRKTQYSLYFSIAVTIVNFFLNFAFVPFLGAQGAAIATGLSHMFYFWIKTIYSRKNWFKFEIGHFVNSSIIITIAALINTLSIIPDIIVYFGDFVLSVMGLVCYREFLMETMKKIKIFRK